MGKVELEDRKANRLDCKVGGFKDNPRPPVPLPIEYGKSFGYGLSRRLGT